MINIDTYAYSNRLRAIHPMEKFSFVIITLIVCLTSSTVFTPLIVLAVMAGGIMIKAGIPRKFFTQLMFLPFSFLLVSVLTLAFSISTSSAGFWLAVNVGGLTIGVRYPDLISAAQLFVKSLGAVSCLYFLALTTPITEIIPVLSKLRVPVIITELMVLIYRFIFVFMEMAMTIRRAQTSRLGYVSRKSTFRSLSQLFSALFGKVFLKSNELFNTMSARGYAGEIRVLAKKYPVCPRNYLVLTLFELSLIIVNYWGGKQFV